MLLFITRKDRKANPILYCQYTGNEHRHTTHNLAHERLHPQKEMCIRDRGDVVERHIHLFVLLVLVVVVLFQCQCLLILDDLLHELHGGVVRARIFLLFGLHHDFREHDVSRLQFDVQHPGAGFQFYFLGDVAYGGERQLIPAFAGFHLDVYKRQASRCLAPRLPAVSLAAIC